MTNLQALPTMLTQVELDQLLKQFPASAIVEREELTIVVKAPKGQKVLSAALYAPNRWHVMAAPGLININVKESGK